MTTQSDSEWRKELATLGGQASSKKKTRAARRNAREPRPARRAFNEAVRLFVAEWKARGRVPMFQSEGRDYIFERFTTDEDRARKIYRNAVKRL